MSITIKSWKNSEDEYEVKRWTYDAKQKRAIPQSLGRLNVTWATEPKLIFDKCNEEEKREIRAFLSETRKGRYQASLSYVDRRFFSIEKELNDALNADLLNIEQLEKLEQFFNNAKKSVVASKKKLTKIKEKEEEKNKANNEELAQENVNANAEQVSEQN